MRFWCTKLNVIEQRFGKRIDKEIALGAEKWVDINRFSSIQNCIDDLKIKVIKLLPLHHITTHAY